MAGDGNVGSEELHRCECSHLRGAEQVLLARCRRGLVLPAPVTVTTTNRAKVLVQCEGSGVLRVVERRI